MPAAVALHPSWFAPLKNEFDQPYMKALKSFLRAEKKAGKQIYPAGDQMFNALNTTPFDQTRVVILGQDPYHGEGQAHGLSFSVPPGIAVPPSLRNIYQELHNDIGFIPPNHGCLQSWAEQGVLLLNATLSVEAGKAGSHQNQGWETFTDRIIEHLSRERRHLVFLLWGSYAQKKGKGIDRSQHLVLTAPHPSPLSAYRGFFGCGHFSAANRYLTSVGIPPIDWQL